MTKDKKNTLLTPQSTKPLDQRIPAKNSFFPQQKPNLPKFNTRTSTAFKTQNRGGDGK